MKIPYFCCIGAELKRYAQDFDFMNQVYLYKVPTDDSIDEVLAEDYFKAISNSVLQDDIVYIYEASAEILHKCRFDKQNGHITAIPLASDETLTGAVTSIIHDNLTPNKLLKSDANGKVAASDFSENDFVKVDGSSIMTGPLKFRAGSFEGAIAGGLGYGISVYKLKADGSIDSEVASLTKTNGFVPGTNNAMDIGKNNLKWKDAHIARVITSVINNGYDIAVPVTNSADTLALKSEVDLAANSGRMILDQGVWYAKMYAATVAPSAENGTNYADFSQTDGQGNPIIVTYNRVNGVWVQDQTITPPAEYDGYVSITSKIWDITEQAGQQGGRILWNHQSKEFTPYPQIISFENAALTGTPTASTPTSSSPNNQIATKGYVDSFSGANTSLSNLTATGKANISSKGTYNSSATYSAGTVGAAISGKADTDFNNTNMIDYVVSFQRPTASNNYTWYRKYKSGWVEQGGQIPSTKASSESKTVNLPITMTDTNYFACSNTGYTGNDAPNYGNVVKSKTTTTITVGHLVNYTTSWMVSGISAEQ